MPSRREWGSDSISFRFMYAPGSPSSALHMRYFSGPAAFCRNSHLFPVRYPAPPRPRSLAALICSMTPTGFWSIRTLYKAWYPPTAMYSSMSSGLISPQLRRTILTCPLKNGISFQFGTSWYPVPYFTWPVRWSQSSILHSTISAGGRYPGPRPFRMSSTWFGCTRCSISSGRPGTHTLTSGSSAQKPKQPTGTSCTARPRASISDAKAL